METLPTLPPLVAELKNQSNSAHYKMIDIHQKNVTVRRAVASGCFYAQPSTIQRIREKSLPKGDALILAEVAGIQGAKLTSTLLPMCHPLNLAAVKVWTSIQHDHIQVFCEAITEAKTGVEMEALSGVNAALLCLYDLTKGIDPVLALGEIKLAIKEGGKSGLWVHPQLKSQSEVKAEPKLDFSGLAAVLITLSDRCANFQAEDVTSKVAKEWMKNNNLNCIEALLLPDDANRLSNEVIRLVEISKPNIIITSGGTGLSARDITPETLAKLCKQLGGREIPGIGERLRSQGSQHNNAAWLSRSTAFVLNQTIIVCLPGSPKAVTQGLDAIADLLLHGLHTVAGGGH